MTEEPHVRISRLAAELADALNEHRMADHVMAVVFPSKSVDFPVQFCLNEELREDIHASYAKRTARKAA